MQLKSVYRYNMRKQNTILMLIFVNIKNPTKHETL